MEGFRDDCHFIFVLFDQDNDGRVQACQLGTMLRMLGQVWSFSDILDLEKQYGANGVRLNTFIKIANERRFKEMKDLSRPKDNQWFAKYKVQNSTELSSSELDELKTCFDLFDPNRTHLISMRDLEQVLKCLGEEMASQDIKSLFTLERLAQRNHLTFNDFCRLCARLN